MGGVEPKEKSKVRQTTRRQQLSAALRSCLFVFFPFLRISDFEFRIFSWLKAALCLCCLLAACHTPQASERVDLAQLSPETEAAINRGLKSLLDQQNHDGSIGERFPVAGTALTLMAFMVQGSFPEKPPNGEPLKRALDFLLTSNRRGTGFLGVSMYEHGLATLALSEAWGMSSRKDDIREALKRAVKVIVVAQNSEGGWRYRPDSHDADISVTVMQAVALASAQEAGIAVPEVTIQNAIKYVKACATPSGGFMYQIHQQGPGFARTAAGVLSLFMCGARDSKEAQQGLSYLVSFNNRKFESSEHYFYAHYYAMQVMYQAGEDYYQVWYPKIRDALLHRQQNDGSFSGMGRSESNAPACDTAFAILILGVPYRFLPIYQR